MLVEKCMVSADTIEWKLVQLSHLTMFRTIIIIALLIQEATLKNLTGLWWANIYRLGFFPLLKIWNMLSWTMMKWKGKMKTLF